MKKACSLALFFLFICTTVFAGSGNNTYMVHNVPFWNQRADDNITNVLMEVWPKGLYADIELTLTLKGNNIFTGSNDSLQGILNFELPPNSFIHDSWLWLNDSTIIVADLIERGKAIQIYSGFIQQRQDPSLLLKTGANTYQLNVFPITNSFSRKVKITFSTLMTQKGDKAMLTLPTDILCGSQIKPGFMALIHTNQTYTNPGFTNTGFNTYVVNTSTNLYLLDMPAASYDFDRPLDLQYSTANTPTMTVFPTSANEGVYELKMPAETPTVSPRHFSIILDHPSSTQWNSGSVYRFAEIKKMLRTFLLTDCLPTDSFNVFYIDNNTVIQAYSGWAAIQTAAVNSLFDNMPNIISTAPTLFQSLLATGIAFGQTKPSQSEHTIIISQNSNYSNLQAASQLFASVQNTVGTFTNKISVLNYAVNGTNTSAGSPILFNNFCATSGGTYYSVAGHFYDGYLSKYTYDMDMRSIMKGIMYYTSGGYNSYNVTLPLSGFAYDSYTPGSTNKYYRWQPYTETGKYYGSISNGTASIEYVGQSGSVTHQVAITTIEQGTNHQMRSWVNNYLLDLESSNNSLLYSEILDSSINNNVLCYETAFLALETGDTLGTDSTKIPSPSSVENNFESKHDVKCYPNPFLLSLTIESSFNIEEISVYDITGRLAFYIKDLNRKTFVWNGQNSNGETISGGVYFVKVRYKDRQETIKVVKL